jgi:hypothetical protein
VKHMKRMTKEMESMPMLVMLCTSLTYTNCSSDHKRHIQYSSTL